MGSLLRKGGQVKRFLSLFLVVLFFWFLFTGSFDRGEIITGAVLSLLITLATKNYYRFNILRLDLPLRIFKFLFVYLPRLIVEMVKANIHMAAIVLNPKLPLDADIIENKTSLTGDISRLVLANSITLTPGTLTLDVIEDAVVIHTVDRRAYTKANSAVAPFENAVKGVFE